MSFLDEDDREKRIIEKSPMYPGITWLESIDFIKTISGIGSRQVSYMTLAKAYNLSSVNTKSFQSKISTSKQFGLITANDQVIQLTDAGKKLIYPTDDEEIRKITVKCFQSPALYRKLVDRFEGKALPTQGLLENILVTDYNITKSAKDTAASCFLQTIQQLGYSQAGVLTFDAFESIISKTNMGTVEQIESKLTKNIQTATIMESRSVSNDYFNLNIPLKSGKSASIYLPNDIEKEDAELIRDMLEVILKRRYGINT